MARVLMPHRTSSAVLAEAQPGDLVIAPGELPLPAIRGVREVRREELVSPEELAATAAAGAAVLRDWCARAAEASFVYGIPLSDAAGGPLLPAYLQALKASLLLARFRARFGDPAEVVGAGGWSALRLGLAGSRRPPALHRVDEHGRRAVLRAGPLFWLWLRRWREQRAGEPPAPPVASTGAILGLANHRNRALLRRAEVAGLRIARLERLRGRKWLRFLPEVPVEANTVPAADAAWNAALEIEPDESVGSFPRAHDWSPGAVLRATLAQGGPDLARGVLREALLWRELIAAVRPRGVLGPLPWGGDLRTVCYVARATGVPFIAVQDAIVSELGASDPLGPSRALAWGPSGREWFEERGLAGSDIAEVGEPYFEEWAARTREIDPEQARRVLGLPYGRRIVLCALMPSAAHSLVLDNDSPLADVEEIARGVAAARGWLLVIKPHRRLATIDGFARVAETWALAGRHGAWLLPPDTDLGLAVAASDVYVSAGDTLSLHAVATGRPAVVLRRAGHAARAPELLSGDLPVAPCAGELTRLLEEGLRRPEVGAVLERHFLLQEPLSEAIERLLADRVAPDEREPTAVCLPTLAPRSR
ncbi:MAG: hypothetical protein KBD01_15420 [Acidobacteria bacterium]|nr:hypothetical protein [Acidobacteriota bacterium]